MYKNLHGPKKKTLNVFSQLLSRFHLSIKQSIIYYGNKFIIKFITQRWALSNLYTWYYKNKLKTFTNCLNTSLDKRRQKARCILRCHVFHSRVFSRAAAGAALRLMNADHSTGAPHSARCFARNRPDSDAEWITLPVTTSGRPLQRSDCRARRFVRTSNRQQQQQLPYVTIAH